METANLDQEGKNGRMSVLSSTGPTVFVSIFYLAWLWRGLTKFPQEMIVHVGPESTVSGRG